MKKIFTLITMAVMALSASAQEKYGIYCDLTTTKGAIMGVDMNENYEFIPGAVKPEGSKVGITYTNGKDTKYVLRLGVNINDNFNGGSLIYDYQPGVEGTAPSTWSAMDPGCFVCTGWADADEVDVNGNGEITADDDASSRWPETEDPKDDKTPKIDYCKKNLYEIAPDYWTGMTVEVPAGETLTVEKISVALGAGNNMWWSVNVFDEAGNMIYDSKVAQIQNGNSPTKDQQNHAGYSADITSTEVIEPLGGEVFHKGSWTYGPPPTTYDYATPVGGTCLPITKEKIATWASSSCGNPCGNKTPASIFQTLPEGGLKLTGKNTVRIYFCCKNSRLLCLPYFYLYGSLGAGGQTGIDNVVVENDANAPVYNVAGQIVGENYKGLVIKNGKKVVIK